MLAAAGPPRTRPARGGGGGGVSSCGPSLALPSMTMAKATSAGLRAPLLTSASCACARSASSSAEMRAISPSLSWRSYRSVSICSRRCCRSMWIWFCLARMNERLSTLGCTSMSESSLSSSASCASAHIRRSRQRLQQTGLDSPRASAAGESHLPICCSRQASCRARSEVTLGAEILVACSACREL